MVTMQRTSTPIPLSLVSPDISTSGEDDIMEPIPAALSFPSGFSERGWTGGRQYEQYSREMSPEGYDDYHPASFIGLLSIVAKRRVKIPLKQPDYTPFTIILTGEPAMSAKTYTRNCINYVLDAAQLGWMYDNSISTPEKLVHDMAGAIPVEYGNGKWNEKQRADFEKQLAFSGQRALNVGEYGQFMKDVLKESGPMAGYHGLLLQMDDNKPTYTRKTLSRSEETVYDPNITIVGDMTVGNVRIMASKEAELWSSGYWSRVTPIVPPPLWWVDKAVGLGELHPPQPLVSSLIAWHKRLGIPDCSIERIIETGKKGEEIVTDRYQVTRQGLPAQSVTFGAGTYEAYVRYRSAIKRLATEVIPEKDLRASYIRLAVKALRCAALLASFDNNGRIELWHWAKAQELAEDWRRSLHELYRQVNNPSLGVSLDEHILTVLKSFDCPASAGDLQRRTRLLKNAKSKIIREHLMQLQRDGLVSLVRDKKAEKWALVSGVQAKKESLPDTDDFNEDDMGM